MFGRILILKIIQYTLKFDTETEESITHVSNLKGKSHTKPPSLSPSSEVLLPLRPEAGLSFITFARPPSPQRWPKSGGGGRRNCPGNGWWKRRHSTTVFHQSWSKVERTFTYGEPDESRPRTESVGGMFVVAVVVC